MINMSRRKAWSAVVFALLLAGCYVWYIAANLDKRESGSWFGF